MFLETVLASDFLVTTQQEVEAFKPHLANLDYSDINVVILKSDNESITLAGQTMLIIPPEVEASPEIIIAHESSLSCIILLCTRSKLSIACSKFAKQTSYTFLLAQGAHLEFTSVFKESYKEAQLTINTHLLGKDSRATLHGAYYLQGATQFSLVTQQKHAAFNTRSDLMLKGYVTDEAKSIHHGAVVIEKEAQQAHVSQYNKTLLGSNQAHARSTPQLEIHAHDVQCKHGTALGSIDEHQTFYLQTRGFDQARAQKMLLEGFFSEFDVAIFNLNSA